jgi:hypothetical protein
LLNRSAVNVGVDLNKWCDAISGPLGAWVPMGLRPRARASAAADYNAAASAITTRR